MRTAAIRYAFYRLARELQLTAVGKRSTGMVCAIAQTIMAKNEQGSTELGTPMVEAR